MSLKIFRDNNIDKLEAAINEFIRPNTAEENKVDLPKRRVEVKRVTAISSHEAYGDHVCIMFYEK